MDRSNKYQTVWAKLRYCSYWPAYIVENPPEMLVNKIPRKKLCVFFFGSRNFGIVSVENVQPYLEFKKKYITKNRSALFLEAIEQADEYMETETQDGSPNRLHTTINRIVLKKELDFDVKIEKYTDEMYSKEEIDVEMKPTADCNDCCAKQMLIDDLNNKLESTTNEFLSSKTEFQHLFVENNKKNREIKRLQSELACLKQQLAESNERRKVQDEQVRVLNIENDRLKHELEESASDGIFDVDKIIQHKKKRGKLLYLIRWEVYGSGDDSWMPECDLNCEEILDRYKKLHNL